MDDTVEVVVIAGQAGLAVSFFLTKSQVEHVVLERGTVGESWRSQRWDSFCLNTPNWSNSLPGLAVGEAAPDAFGHRDDVVSYFERYAQNFDLPVRQHTPVTRLERAPTGLYEVRSGAGAVRAKAVVLATGSMSRPRIPEMGRRLPRDVVSTSAGGYRAAGRRVFLCASRVGRVPRV